MTTLDRTKAPAFQLSDHFQLPQPATYRFRNGAPLLFFDRLPEGVARLEIVLRAGAWTDTMPGLSHFTFQLLSKGSRHRNAFETAQAFESLGAQLEVFPGHDFVTLSLYALTRTLPEAVALLKELIEEPAFDEAELQQLKDIYVQNLRINLEKTSFLATTRFRASIYGQDHPYGHTLTEKEVAAVSREDLLRFWTRVWSVQAATLVAPMAAKAVEALVAGFPAGPEKSDLATSHVITPEVPRDIDLPESVQTSIRLGRRCIRREAQSSYYEAVLANHLIGGFFGSRLMKNIREEKGLTYGIYSSMHHFANDSFWVIGAEVNKAQKLVARNEIHNEINRLANELVSSQELEAARNYLIGSWQSENATLFAVADKVKSLYLAGLPADFYDCMFQHILHMRPESLREAVRKHFDSSHLVEVFAG